MEAHIDQIDKYASEKLGVLFRWYTYFSLEQLFKLYMCLIHSCLEYCSYIWDGSSSVSVLGIIKRKAFVLSITKNITDPLDRLSFSLRRKVGSLSLFYRYYLGHCSSEQPLPRPHCTHQAVAWRVVQHLYWAIQ